MKCFASLTCAVLFVPLVWGCPGGLSNPEDFIGGGATPKDAETVLAQSCGTMGCHDDSPQAQAGLDLLSPNVDTRLVDVYATGEGCESDIFVVAGDPDGSFLLDKVLNTPGICGLPMPVVGTLAVSDVETLRQWIIDLDSSDAGTPDGG